MQFQVPQFIETEDKIVGPLTLQFLYFAMAGGISFILFFFLSLPFWIFVAIILTTTAAAFAFIKVNGRPLSVAAFSALGFYWQPRFYLWQKSQEKEQIPTIKEEPKITQIKSRIDDLWDRLQTSKEPIPKREKAISPVIAEQARAGKEQFETMRKITGEKEVARRIDYK
jgi:hypothetical protein